MKTALINTETQTVVSVYSGNPPARLDITPTLQVHGAGVGWTGEGYAIVSVTELTIPDGQILDGEYAYEIQDGVVVETGDLIPAPPPDPHYLVPKWMVHLRLSELGLMEAARTALWSDAYKWARWFDPGYPEVYADDTDTNLLLQYIGADPAVILARPE